MSGNATVHCRENKNKTKIRIKNLLKKKLSVKKFHHHICPYSAYSAVRKKGRLKTQIPKKKNSTIKIP